MIFLCILASSWKAFGLIFASILRSKFHQKMHSKFHRFLDRFWEAFGLPWPPIWLPKSLQKSIQAALGAQRGPWSVPGSLRTLKSHQKWSPKWAQDPQNRPFFVALGFQNGAPELPTWNPKAPDLPKMDSDLGNPKWTQNKSNIKPNKRNIWNQTRSNMEPTWHQILDSLIRPNVW